MNKKCSYVMEKFLELDKNQHIPLNMTAHILNCNECRNQIKMYTQAEKLLSKNEENLFDFVPTSQVMEKIYPGSTKPKKMPILHWLIIGILLLICMICCSIIIAKYIPQLNPLSFIFIAGVICTYCMMFVWCNMDYFVKS